MIAVSIIIVNYNTKFLTKNCLESIFSNTKNIDFEVIVSDNGSTDGSIDMIRSEFPQVVLIENGSNLGFGAANNCGLKIAQGKYIFFLNSDTVLLNNAVKIFFDYWENSPEKEKIGALGCYLERDERIIHSYSQFPNCLNMLYTLLRGYISFFFGFLKRFKHKKVVADEIQRKDESKKIAGYVTGADLFVKNSEELKFDERFFMYFEESDLQYNLFYKHGLYIYILAEPKIVHLEGASDNSQQKSLKQYDFGKKSSICYWISCIKYFRKNSRNIFCIYLLKFFILLIWLFPYNIKKTAPFIRELLKI